MTTSSVQLSAGGREDAAIVTVALTSEPFKDVVLEEILIPATQYTTVRRIRDRVVRDNPADATPGHGWLVGPLAARVPTPCTCNQPVSRCVLYNRIV